MLVISPSRRSHVVSGKKKPSMQLHRFLPPIAGWVSNTMLANQQLQSAFVLENFWPSLGTIEPRGGTDFRCSIEKSVTALFEYKNQYRNFYFAADKNNLYQFNKNTNDGERLVPIVSGQTSGDYSTIEMKTDGGTYLIVVNGSNKALIYDGTSWQKITQTSKPFAIKNVASESLSNCWIYRNRIFFTQVGTLDAWYLDINSVAGVAYRLPLSAVFGKGGSLMLGARWSSDSGGGLDDRCVFITDKGEAAIFEGSNPSDVNSWKLIGVYDIGEPLGKNAFMNVGGDFLIATKIGLVPLSAAVQKDVSSLKLHVASRSIDPDWRFETILSGNQKNWHIAKWDSRNMGIVSPPPNSKYENGYCWVVNLESGAWSKFTGWRINAMNILGDSLFYGDTDGKIFAADIGGEDNGRAFECKVCFAFENFGLPAIFKTSHILRATWRYRVANSSAIYSVASDYQPQFLPPPSAVEAIVESEDCTWENTAWDSNIWAKGFTKDKIYTVSKTIAAQGTTLAPQIQLISSQSTKLDCELISLEFIYETGEVVL